jgi:hypothetical protein
MSLKPSSLLMIRPSNFAYNPQTADTNLFQKRQSVIQSEIQNKALFEFENMLELLYKNNIEVNVFSDLHNSDTPDSIFPNNWISFHQKGIVLYPMYAPNRRLERRTDIIRFFQKQEKEIHDWTFYEKENLFLEGTGSLVFDYIHRKCYASLSPRTHKIVFEKLMQFLEIEGVLFTARDAKQNLIYHTNVMLSIGNKFAVICSESIENKDEQHFVLQQLQQDGLEIIDISLLQMNAFAGNCYQLVNKNSEAFILISEQGLKSLMPNQIRMLEQHGGIIAPPVYTIEEYGGGSVRCMIADIRED